MNIIELFLTAAETYPNKVAIQDPKTSITYKALRIAIQETAAYYTKKGISQNDRVLVFVPLSVNLYIHVLAIFYIGATAVFLDEWTNKSRLENCCKTANCKGFVGSWKAQCLRFFSKPLKKIPIRLNTTSRMEENLPPKQMSTEQSALITFTTGSTGTPKAADRTHGFLIAQYEACLLYTSPSPRDRG